MVGLFADPTLAGVQLCPGRALLLRRRIDGSAQRSRRRCCSTKAFKPAYCEDADLCLRLLSRGRRVVYCPEAEVVHHLSVSTNKQSVTRRLQTGRQESAEADREVGELLEDINTVTA